MQSKEVVAYKSRRRCPRCINGWLVFGVEEGYCLNCGHRVDHASVTFEKGLNTLFLKWTQEGPDRSEVGFNMLQSV